MHFSGPILPPDLASPFGTSTLVITFVVRSFGIPRTGFHLELSCADAGRNDDDDNGDIKMMIMLLLMMMMLIIMIITIIIKMIIIIIIMVIIIITKI